MPGQECNPQQMTVRDLRCGDRVHVNGYFSHIFGPDHWTASGSARESWPVPGEYHVPKSACGTLAPFPTLDTPVLVCETGLCRSPLCGAEHRDGPQ